jgi:hypothetical protein
MGLGMLPYPLNKYRIAGNFRGIQFLRISSYPRNKYNCTVYNGHDRPHPRKLNRENFEDWPSAKIGPHKNFPLYGNHKSPISRPCGTAYHYHHLLLAAFAPAVVVEVDSTGARM